MCKYQSTSALLWNSHPTAAVITTLCTAWGVLLKQNKEPTNEAVLRKNGVWFSLPVWQTAVPAHHCWFQMSDDALSLHWSQALVVSGLGKTDDVGLAVICVTAERWMEELFPTETEEAASLADRSPVLKQLSAWGFRHQAQDQAVDILKLHSIPGRSPRRQEQQMKCS